MTTNASTDNSPFYHHLHKTYIATLKEKIDHPDSYEGAVTEHLRMSGIYWSLTALSLLTIPSEVDKLMNLTSSPISTNSVQESENKTEDGQCIVDWVFKCYDSKTGGFAGNVGHDGHILYTLSALQILALAGRLKDSRLDVRAVINFICGLQQPDGSFSGDEWGEVDTRFSYCALSSLSLLGALNSEPVEGETCVDVDKAAIYVASCQNFDGGFGMTPGAESHAGQIFCCVGALSICKRLDLLHDADLLCWWLAERQCDSGGLNGRPEKQADVCYSWWILSSLCILGRIDWIRGDKLSSFILKCQDDDDGGIADRPGDMPDVFHTFFGIAGLSLIGHLHGGITLADTDTNDQKGDEKEQITQNYRRVDPIYALPTDVVQQLSLQGQVMNPCDDRLKQYDVFP